MIHLVHETPTRLRLKGPVSGDQRATLSALAGVRSVRHNRAAASLIIDHDGAPATRAAILDAAGVAEDRGPADGDRPALPRLLSGAPRLAVSGLMVLAVPFVRGPWRRWLVLAHIAPTLATGMVSLAREGVTVEVLDAAAVGLSAARREYGTASTTQFLLDLADFLESTTVRRTDALVASLMHPNPKTAWIERDGAVIEIPFAEVVTGDRVVVGTGELVPVDGTVVMGEGTVDQAAVTGESLPIPRESGDRVLSGSVVAEGRLVLTAEQVGDATTMARIAGFIADALARRSDTQRVAEDLANQRVMITMGSAGLVFLLTRDFRRLASVFLVDYSCATKLGVSVAVKAAMYRAARRGLLVKGGHALEQLAQADTVVFDKTGTLTHGRLEVTDILVFDPDLDREGLLAIVASVAEHSHHPVADAVVRMAHRESLDHISHEAVDFIVGHGLKARVGERELRIGSRHYMEAHLAVSFADHDDAILAREREGKTILHVAVDGRASGVIALRDTVREEASETLVRLRHLGIAHLAMVTGDRAETARSLGDALGLDEVIWEAAPEDKADILARLRREGRRVVFVGDGVNDGPALTAADVGLAMAAGADLARASADVVLLDDRLAGVADARDLARRTMGLIDRNFQAAAAINTAILGGAVFGRLSPLATAVLHNGTTLGVLVAAALAGRGLPGRRETR